MTNYSPANRKLLSILCHGACFFSATIVSVGIPIAILLLTEDSVIKANAREALNFQITVFAVGIVGLLLSLIIIGWFLLMALWGFSLIFPIIAIVKILEQPDRPYRYPLIFRVV